MDEVIQSEFLREANKLNQNFRFTGHQNRWNEKLCYSCFNKGSHEEFDESKYPRMRWCCKIGKFFVQMDTVCDNWKLTKNKEILRGLNLANINGR